MKKILGKIHYLTRFVLMLARSLFWKVLLRESAKGIRGMVKINGRIIINRPDNIYIGKYSTINEGVMLNADEKIIIGNHVRISPYSVIITTGLKTNEFGSRSHASAPIIIEDGAWIGTGSIILPGIKIGRDSAVAAGSVVTKDVPPKTLVAGVPAQIKKAL
jgi:acetyltransferase-like isoleucine patch superfamily enzyme